MGKFVPSPQRNPRGVIEETQAVLRDLCAELQRVAQLTDYAVSSGLYERARRSALLVGLVMVIADDDQYRRRKRRRGKQKTGCDSPPREIGGTS